MKRLLLSFFMVSTLIAAAQTKECDCSAALSSDLTTVTKNSEYRKLKEFLYEYFTSDATTQTSMKNDKSYNWTSSAEAVIKAIPVKGTGNANVSNSEESQVYTRLEQTYLKNHYLTNEEFNELYARTMSDNQLKGYLGCLELCKEARGVGGLSSIVSGNTDDEFSIQINFNSVPAGQQITLRGNASYPNLEPIGELMFKDGLVIKDGQSIIQYFKRLDPTKSASFSFNVREGNANVKAINFAGKPTVNSQQTPIGTIVASVLNYNDFLQANGLTIVGDMSKAIWVPCDGRTLNASTYAKYGTVPDLRGVFIRGINDYGVTYSGVANVADDHKNPQDKKAGEFQGEDVGSHSHLLDVLRDPKLGFRSGVSGAGYNSADEFPNASTYQVSTKPSSGTETRPKNVTVYYYIKIN